MKTYDQLETADKMLAINYFQTNMLIEMARGALRFQDSINNNGWQNRIDKIIQENANKHPILIAKVLSEDSVINQAAFDIGKNHAFMSLYLEENENAVDLADVRSVGQEHVHDDNCNHKLN